MEEYSDGNTWTTSSNTHTEQHGTPLDGRGGGHNTCHETAPDEAGAPPRGGSNDCI